MTDKPNEYATTSDDGNDASLLNLLICDGLAPLDLPASSRADLRGRLLRRIGESARRHAGLLTIRRGEGEWRQVRAGIRAKLLTEGAHGNSLVIEFAPGTSLPVHRHQHLEEGIVLSGSLQLGDLSLAPGDYHVSPPGSRHARISSRAGAVAYLRGSSLGHSRAVIGELLGALLPGDGPAVQTLLAGGGDWEQIAPGVEQRILWRDGDVTSCFIRLAAGCRLPAHVHAGEEECIMVSGDAYFGDLLIQAGDFHLALAGSEHGDVSSDNGALAYLRGRTPLALPPRP